MEAFNYVLENRDHWNIVALEFLEKVFCLHGKANIPLISKEARKLLSECNFIFETSREGSLSKRMTAIKKYQNLLVMIQDDERAREVVIDVLCHLGICYLNIGDYSAAGANFASAWSLCSTLSLGSTSTHQDLKKDIAYQIAQCKKKKTGTSKGLLIGINLFVIALECFQHASKVYGVSNRR